MSNNTEIKQDPKEFANKLNEEASEVKKARNLLEQEKRKLVKHIELVRDREARCKTQEDKLHKERLVQQQQNNEKQAELSSLQNSLAVRAQEIENGLPDLAKKYIDDERQLLNQGKEQFEGEKKAFSVKQTEFAKWESELTQKQQELDSDFVSQRTVLNKELAALRTEKISAFYLEISNEEAIARKKIDQSLSQIKADLEDGLKSLKDDQGVVKAEKLNLQAEKTNLEQQKNDLESRIDQGIEAERNRLENDIASLNQQNSLLLTQVRQADSSVKLFETLQSKLGNQSPEKVLELLSAREEEINRLQDEIINRPSKEIQDYYDDAKRQIEALELRNEKLTNENKTLKDATDGVDEIEYELSREKRRIASLQSRYDAISADNNQLREDLKRLNPAYEEEESRDKRIAHVKREVIPFANNKPVPRKESEDVNELSWLQQIQKDTENYGLYFSQRILFAFHTALKTAEWSPLTVLAGVSGTGKSELPKLYSHFGGINFLNVPVQPNWDSQESMLGYFNSIDNCYEAKPMLNFLAQSREPLSVVGDAKYHGLDDTVSLVLLDEMNLAHVELYFADFLSKLEQRRGSSKNKLPSISISLGANIDEYKISLGRNLLFAGTMNQDETTKSLSDKVIDRGTLIFFPRPTELRERKELKALIEPAELLKFKSWTSWIKIASDLDTSNYKKMIEEINSYLGSVGKALGHRVWQSIEYYMVNHPLVCALDANRYPDEYQEALDLAFEDQIVQKVMPKLRGIETRGYGKTECLDKIRTLLDEKRVNLLSDFDHACRVGHGQFMWASAEYLNDEATNKRYQELVDLTLKNTSSVSEHSSIVESSNEEMPISSEEFKLFLKEAHDQKVEIGAITVPEVKTVLEALDIDLKKTKPLHDYLSSQGPSL